MREFKRGLQNQKFIDELKKNIHFQKMVSDPDLLIAIRNEYLNVYFYGQSICRISFTYDKLKFTSHKKYIGKDLEAADYHITPDYYLNNLEQLKRKAFEHRGKEKEQVKEHIIKDKSSCIFDVEVSLEGGYIEYVVIDKIDNKFKLVFYEAKHFDNPGIRATEEPKVFQQMKKYEYALNLQKKNILDSYKTVYDNICQLGLQNKANLIKMIGETFDNIEIDTRPYLIIFKVDYQKKGRIDHIEKLKKEFADRLILLPKQG